MTAGLPQGVGEGFERAFDLVGGHGPFQWRLLLIVSLQLIVCTWHHIGYAFMGNVPDHWCTLPDSLQKTDWTLEQQKLFYIPHDEPQSLLNSGEKIFHKCDHYQHDNLESVLDSGRVSFDIIYGSVDWENVSTTSCKNWEFDHSIYRSTVAEDFGLVCDNRWKVATIQGSYMIANLLGTITFGSLSDRYLGRRRTILTAASMVVSGGILAAFSTSYWMFLLFRCVIAMGASGCMQNSFILLTEHCGKKHRALMGIVEQVAFAIGYMMLPIFAYFLREWNKLQLTFGTMSLVLVVYYWILPESPRWLATHGETDRAIGALNRMARVNRLPKPNRDDLEEIVRQCHAETQQIKAVISSEASPSGLGLIAGWVRAIGKNFGNLMKTAEMRKRSLVFWALFFTVMSVYYGNVFAANITSDPYLLVFLSGLMEVPAYTVIVPFVSKFGRKPTTAGNFFLTGICMLILSGTPKSYELVRITLAMLAKLFISAAFAIIYLLGAELYPTELRTTGLAVGIVAGRVGAICAPYVLDLTAQVYRDLPTIIFGILSIGGGVVSLLLPETKTLNMTDKVVEIEMHAKEEKRRQSIAASIRSGA